MSYDNGDDEPRIRVDLPTEADRYTEVMLTPDAIAGALGVPEADVLDALRAGVDGAVDLDCVRLAHPSAVALRVALALGRARWGEPLDPVDDPAIRTYFGGWDSPSLSLMRVDDDVELVAYAPDPRRFRAWHITGEVRPPYAALTPLPEALAEAGAWALAARAGAAS